MKPLCRRIVGLVGRYAVFQNGARVGVVLRRPRGRLPWSFLPLRLQRARGEYSTRAEAVAALLMARNDGNERARDTDGRGNPIDTDADYYVQEAAGDASGLVGNCMRFWRADGGGYTCQLGEAGVYKGCVCLTMRPTNVPWPVEFIRAHAVMLSKAQR